DDHDEQHHPPQAQQRDRHGQDSGGLQGDHRGPWNPLGNRRRVGGRRERNDFGRSTGVQTGLFLLWPGPLLLRLRRALGGLGRQGTPEEGSSPSTLVDPGKLAQGSTSVWKGGRRERKRHAVTNGWRKQRPLERQRIQRQ